MDMNTIKRLIYSDPLFITLALFLFCSIGSGLTQSVEIKKMPFSYRTSDEFSPVLYNNGLVFCSNQRDNSLIGYYNSEGRLFKIFYAIKKKTGWKTPALLSLQAIPGFNDGPATFNKKQDFMFFSRNTFTDKKLWNVHDSIGKLAIYSAELVNGIWKNVKPFEYNNPLYIYTTPALTPDGNRLYFSSDMPGGEGGMDLYYCSRSGSGWSKPRNLGPSVNTAGNESFPFADASGRLYFASDGREGLGGKDLYFTIEENGFWQNPIPLDSAINSGADDFGIYTDSTSQNGYFSSNRYGSDDIFYFKNSVPDFETCDTAVEDNYCFTFYDERYTSVDTLQLQYKWDFGNGIIINETEAEHCFPGPGDYKVDLTIIDLLSHDTVSRVSYPVNLPIPQEPYINSVRVGISGKNILFDASSSIVPGSTIINYLWDFGEGFEFSRSKMYRSFKKGNYQVRLGLQTSANSSCLTKQLRIYESYQTLKTFILAGNSDLLILEMDDLSADQRSDIEKAFQNPAGNTINDSGLYAILIPFLEKAINVLNKDPEARLEIMISNVNSNTGGKGFEYSAQQIEYFFKTRGLENRAACRQVLRNQLISGNEATFKDSRVEFIFMNR
jgi:hypothetical protein